VDVDRFKAVNDEHGHQVGDEVLCQLATALRRAVRQEDVVARYGGEEFVVLLPDAGEDQAVAVAERLRAAAGEVSRLPTTISVGVAVLDPGAGGAGLVARADTALYEAKRAGRDQVVLWRPSRTVSTG
jgi:diguanylate cyclase (GGDEF)-like protein